MITAVFQPLNPHVRSFPLYLSSVEAGFPSPADDYIERSLDLNEYLIKHPAATFFVRVKGDSMTGAGILDGDILVVDRSVRPAQNRIVIAVVGGEFTVKRFRKEKGRVRLIAENPDYPDIEITPDMDFEIWGVVVSAIHRL
ncbi:MAG: LexA family protein [Candidatus Omnitrophota bacterium]